MRRLFPLFLFVVLLVTSGVTRVSASGRVTPQLQRFSRTEYLMGVDFRIDLFARSEMNADRAFKAAFSRIADLDQCMSNYRADSELSLLCTNATKNQSIKVSED